MKFAHALHGIPVLSGTSERTLLYPAPDTDQRYEDRTTGVTYRWNGSAWVTVGAGANVATVINVMAPQYGAVGDGVTDDTVAIQAALDAGKGQTILIPAGTFLAGGLTMIGSSYDGTTIQCIGELKLKADGGVNNFHGVFGGLIVQSVDRVTLDLRWNGNRAAQSDREFVHCVVLAGVTNIRIPSLVGREVRGDVCIIYETIPNTSGANSRNVSIGRITGINTADDGRNTLSVISCDGLTVDVLESYKVGGVVGGVQMPGGFDIEPELSTHRVNDVVVSSLNVTTAGSSGLAVLGVAITNDATRDWNVQRVTIHKARVSGTSLTRPIVKRVRDGNIAVESICTGTRTEGGYLDFLDRVTVDITTRHSSVGCYLGYADFIYDSDITVRTSDFTTAGISVAGIGRSTVRGRVFDSIAGVRGVAFGQNGRGGMTQNGVKYEVDVPYDGVLTTGYWNDSGAPLNFANGTCIRNCDLTGYASLGAAVTGAFPLFNVQGIPTTSANRGDADVTLTVYGDAKVQRFTSALTANRTVTLPTTEVYDGAVFRIVRTGLGAFTLDVGGLKTIPSSTAAFVEVTYNGLSTAWILTGYGTL